MTRKRRLHSTALDNLVANLRGEVGEVITGWVVWRRLRAQEHALQTDDLAADMRNSELNVLSILSSRIYDDTVARLAELAERKIGRLTFYFAAQKLDAFHREVERFQGFVESRRFREKRNHDIAHKELPEQWADHKHIHVAYPDVVRAVALAARLMKRIDRLVLGPAAVYGLQKARARRYDLIAPPRAAYLMMPYIRLSHLERLRIVLAEEAEGRPVWSEVATLVDGEPGTVIVAKQWGVLHMGDRIVAMDEYPVQQITSITSRSVNEQDK